jgi:hypothetical protein
MKRQSKSKKDDGKINLLSRLMRADKKMARIQRFPHRDQSAIQQKLNDEIMDARHDVVSCIRFLRRLEIIEFT